MDFKNFPFKNFPRVGVGTDVHAIDPDRPCWIACMEFPGVAGCAGHSDADVVAHALCDALLAASALGDLGSFIGVDRPEYKGASGRLLLEEVCRHLRDNGFEIINASVQLIAQTPVMMPVRLQGQELLSEIVQAPVSLSATTTDHLGFTGNNEGRAAIATALVVKMDM